MANRNRLIESWQKRLKLGLQLTHNASPRLRAIGQIYVRVYRFLLSTYSTTFWGESPEPPRPEGSAVPPVSKESSTPPREELQGTPAKPIERMRGTLDRIQAANESSGTSESLSTTKPKQGLGNSDWIAVATESRRISVEKCAELFRKNEVVARIVVRGRQRIIEVPFCHRERAFTLIRESPRLIRHLPIAHGQKISANDLKYDILNEDFLIVVGAILIPIGLLATALIISILIAALSD